MSRTPHGSPEGEADLLAAWEAALAEVGLRIRWFQTSDPGAPWSVDALNRSGEQVGNGMGDTHAEALEVLVWSVLGHDPTHAS